MKNRILNVTFCLLAFVGIASTAFAAELPWSNEWARTISIKKVAGTKLKLQYGFTKKAFLGNTFAEMNALIAKLTGDPKAFITPEYLNFYMGYEAIGFTDYAKDQGDFVIDEELQAIQAKSDAGTLVKEDFKNNRRWIHIVNAIDKEEINCIAISVIAGVTAGCGDVWQGGITDDEVVCHKDYNYLKCHVGCLNKIYNRQAEVTEGFCPERK